MFGAILTAIGSFIGSIATTIGPTIAAFAKSAVGIITKLKLTDTIPLVANVIHIVADVLKIKTDDNSEMLGARAMESQKSLDDFNSAEAYINYLKDNISIDKEKIREFSEEKRMACNAVGMTIETKAIEEKFGNLVISPECLATLSKLIARGIEINPIELVGIIKTLKAQGITNLNDVVEFLEGKGNFPFSCCSKKL